MTVTAAVGNKSAGAAAKSTIVGVIGAATAVVVVAAASIAVTPTEFGMFEVERTGIYLDLYLRRG